MDLSFPINDLTLTRYPAGPHKTFLKEWPSSVSLPDDIDEDEFFAAILEFEERRQLGLLGRWPFWEIREWAIRHPVAAERALCAFILIAGTALGVLWHVVSPSIPWIRPRP